MEDKVVIITGASSGIGKGIAVHFASIGYKNLVLVARRLEQLEETAKKCREVGAKRVEVISKALDQPGACKSVVDEVVEKMKRIDIVIINHGGGKFCSVRDTDLNDFKANMDQNLTSYFDLTKNVLPHLEKTKGNILYTSSVAADMCYPNLSGYSVTKAALNHLARCVALEEAPKGIRVNVISPGAVMVEYQIKMLGRDPDSEEDKAAHREQAKGWQPLGRIGEPIDMAKLAAFIVSEDNTFMTGTVVRCDGGAILGGVPDFMKNVGEEKIGE